MNLNYKFKGCYRRPEERISIYAGTLATNGQWPFGELQGEDNFAQGLSNDPEIQFCNISEAFKTATKVGIDHYYISVVGVEDKVYAYVNGIGIPSDLDTDSKCIINSDDLSLGKMPGDIDNISYAVYEYGSFNNPLISNDVIEYQVPNLSFDDNGNISSLNPLSGYMDPLQGYIQSDTIYDPNESADVTIKTPYRSIKQLFNDVREYMIENNHTKFYLGLAYITYDGAIGPIICNIAGPDLSNVQPNTHTKELSGIKMGEYVRQNDSYSSISFAIHELTLNNDDVIDDISTPCNRIPHTPVYNTTHRNNSSSIISVVLVIIIIIVIAGYYMMRSRK
jgi:hypothetical protein